MVFGSTNREVMTMRLSGSALGTALILLGLVTMLSLPVLQQMAEWRSSYQQLIKTEDERLNTAYRDWLKVHSSTANQP